MANKITPPERFSPVQWQDSSGTAISATQLNRLENALVELLGEENKSGAVHNLVDTVNKIPDTYAELKHNHLWDDITNHPTDLKEFTDTTSIYATKSQLDDVSVSIPTKVSQLENDQGYLTQHQSLEGKADKDHKHKLEDITDTDFSAYATKAWVTDQEYLTSIPTEYITESELNEKGYLTEHQDLSSYATQEFVKTEVQNVNNINFDDYYTKQDAIGTEDTVVLSCGDSTKLID